MQSSASHRGQIVALISFLTQGRASHMAKELSRAVHAQTGQSTLLVELVFSPASVPPRDWTVFQRGINSAFWFAQHLERAEGGFNQLTLPISGESQQEYIAALLNHCARHFDHVLLLVNAMAIPVPAVPEHVRQADLGFLLLEQTEDGLSRVNALQRNLRSSTGSCASIKTVLCIAENESARDFCGRMRQSGGLIDAYIHNCPTVVHEGQKPGDWGNKYFLRDIRHLARQIGHRQVGLALSAGGARGLAHIGVIQVLEENGIEVDVIAGCSMGAYVGAVWAYGHNGIFMERLAREVEHRWGLVQLIDPFIFPRQGFIRGEKVKSRLKKSIGDSHFSDLMRPLRIVATNLNTLEGVVFSSGEVAAAVHASSAIPGVCAPVRIDGETYIDGGIADPVPIDVLEEMGIERIIAVNTIPTPAGLRCGWEIERERAELAAGRSHKLKAILNQHLNYFAPGNILDTMLRSMHGAQMRVAEQACRRAHVVLRPSTSDSHWHDFRHPGKYIALGRRLTEEHLEEIKSLVTRKESHSEDATTDDAMAAVA